MVIYLDSTAFLFTRPFPMSLAPTSWMQNALKTILSSLLVLSLVTGCALPQVSAEDRLFLDVSVDLVGSFTLPKQDFEGDPIGGISAIAYDIPRDRLYALSDSRDRPHLYTFKATGLTDGTPTLIPEAVTYLKDNEGSPYAPGKLDPEGMAFVPPDKLLISSEGSPAGGIAPAVGEYSLATGQLQTVLPLPDRYIPDGILNTERTQKGLNAVKAQGIQENISFEALAINLSSGTGGVYEPYRLFVATEGPLLQDLDLTADIPYKNRLLHYTIDQYQTTLVSEHLYEMELSPTGAVLHGLSEIAVLDQGGHFLGIERSYGFQGFNIKLFQLASGGATDISAIASLQGDTSGIGPIRKKLVLDLADLPLPLQNYEAMTFGPSLPNGDRTLIVASDDNFDPEQDTNFLVFDLKQT